MKFPNQPLARLFLLIGFLLSSLSSFAQTCPAGSYCGLCPAGTFSAAGAASCTPCGSGMFSSSGAASCTALSASNYLTGGSVTTGTGFSGQAACPSSQVSRTHGANSIALGNFYGTSYPIAAYTTCLTDYTYGQCPPGTTGGCTPPPSCNGGSFLVTINNSKYCALAPRGSYASGGTGGGPSLCPSGKTTTSLGNSSLSACQ